MYKRRAGRRILGIGEVGGLIVLAVRLFGRVDLWFAVRRTWSRGGVRGQMVSAVRLFVRVALLFGYL